MFNSIIHKSINLLIFFILVFQIFLIYLNSKISVEEIQKKNISVENFSSFVLSRYGITSFGSQRLNKLSEYKIFLEGYSYLENDVYKIYGEDIHVDTQSEISSSEKQVEMINSMGIVKANGFKNIGSEGKIIFLGESSFKFHE